MFSDLIFILAQENPVDHVVNSVPSWGTGDLFGMKGVWLWNAHVGTLLLSGIITIALLWWAATKIRTGSELAGG